MSSSTKPSVPPPSENYRLTGKNVFISGGTAGIGAAVAFEFAKRGANLYIAGRNAAEAERVLAEAKRLSKAAIPDAEPSYGFYPFDATSIQDTKRLADDLVKLFSNLGGLHFLLLTHGGVAEFGPFTKRRVTKEGHEWFLAVHDLSRFVLATQLLPVVSNSGGGGVVFDILSGGLWNKFDENNLELEGSRVNFPVVAPRDGAIHDIMALEFNERYPKVKYNHAFPGLVRTNIGKGLGWYTRLLWAITFLFTGAQTPEKYAETLFNNITIWDRYEGAAEGIDEKLLSTRIWQPGPTPTEVQEYPRRPEVRRKVWAFLEETTGIKVGSATQ